MKIREMTKLDLDSLLILAHKFYNESPAYQRFKFSPKVAGMTLLRGMDEPMKCVYVAEHEGEILGWIIAQAFQMPVSEELMSCDCGLFITKQSRGKKAGAALIEAYVHWAKDLGVSQIRLDINSGIDQERTLAFFKKLGFQEVGLHLVLGGY